MKSLFIKARQMRQIIHLFNMHLIKTKQFLFIAFIAPLLINIIFANLILPAYALGFVLSATSISIALLSIGFMFSTFKNTNVSKQFRVQKINQSLVVFVLFIYFTLVNIFFLFYTYGMAILFETVGLTSNSLTVSPNVFLSKEFISVENLKILSALIPEIKGLLANGNLEFLRDLEEFLPEFKTLVNEIKDILGADPSTDDIVSALDKLKVLVDEILADDVISVAIDRIILVDYRESFDGWLNLTDVVGIPGIRLFADIYPFGEGAAVLSIDGVTDGMSYAGGVTAQDFIEQLKTDIKDPQYNIDGLLTFLTTTLPGLVEDLPDKYDPNNGIISELIKFLSGNELDVVLEGGTSNRIDAVKTLAQFDEIRRLWSESGPHSETIVANIRELWPLFAEILEINPDGEWVYLEIASNVSDRTIVESISHLMPSHIFQTLFLFSMLASLNTALAFAFVSVCKKHFMYQGTSFPIAILIMLFSFAPLLFVIFSNTPEISKMAYIFPQTWITEWINEHHIYTTRGLNDPNRTSYDFWRIWSLWTRESENNYTFTGHAIYWICATLFLGGVVAVRRNHFFVE